MNGDSGGDRVRDGFTIRIFVPDGDPEGVRIVDRMTSTGVAIAFPRDHWPRVKSRSEFAKAGVYVLVGYVGDDDLPTLYIGQGDGTRPRIDSHFEHKDFWNWGVAFCSKAADAGLNRAHITWLEHALVKRAEEAGRSRLDNGNSPQEPGLSESDKADVKVFLKEILQILPLVGLRAFEIPTAVAEPAVTGASMTVPARKRDETDTIIVPAQKEGFDRVFLGENAWWAIRIAGGMLPKIKYIAAYQTRPVMAVTHVAPVARIEPYGEEGKYKVVFSEPAREIKPIPFADAPTGSMQGPRYTTHAKLLAAKTVKDLI
jgi:hypothetical protein